VALWNAARLIQNMYESYTVHVVSSDERGEANPSPVLPLGRLPEQHDIEVRYRRCSRCEEAESKGAHRRDLLHH
jgi:hypothetical protein